MLVGLEHVGIAVRHLDQSLAFYQGLLGMRLLLRKQAASGDELAFLDAGSAQLELICPKPDIATPARQIPPTEAGVRHLTFAFENVDAMYDRLTEAGVVAVEQPRDAVNREILARVAFVLDPDGIVIELAQRNDAAEPRR